MTSMPAPPLHSQEAISLRTLVNDILGDSAGNQGVTITTKFISKAIESTHRNIARATILGNLDLILEKEVQAGHFSKIGPDTYAVRKDKELEKAVDEAVSRTNLFINENYVQHAYIVSEAGFVDLCRHH